MPSGENRPFSIDEEYHTKRFIHQFQFNGTLAKGRKYQGYFSFSDLERDKSRYSKNLVTQEKTLTTGAGDQENSSYQVWELGGNWNHNWPSQLSLQSGYQLTFEKVGGGRIAEGIQSVENLALFTSLEWAGWKRLQVRPGLRFAQNSGFGSEWVPSLQMKYNFSDALDARFSYGRGFRAPSVRERFFEFVDTNHRIFGNPDLRPEFSNFLSFEVIRKGLLNSHDSKTTINGFYNSIKDQIALAQSFGDATAVQYFNINRHRTLGIKLVQAFELKLVKLDFGLSYIGRSSKLAAFTGNNVKDYLYTPEFNLNLSGSVFSKLDFGIYYKYSGRIQTYTIDDKDNGDSVISLAQINGFHWLDINANHPLGQRLHISAGIRNLTNVRNINNSGVATGNHGSSGSVPVSYGCSFIIKIQYKLSIND